MDHSSLVDAVRIQGAGLCEAVAAGPVSAPVPTCGGWDVADLAVHVGSFCGFWTHVLCEGTGQEKTPFPDPPGGDQLSGWVTELHRQLVDALSDTPPDVEVWTWFDNDHSAGFVTRRCAHELAIHRYDAESARDTSAPVPVELAVDGIDEILDALLEARDRSGQGSGRVLALRSSDVGMEWAISIGPDRVEVGRQSQEDAPLEGSDLIVTASASDLELLLYQRPTLGVVDIVGDLTVLDEWRREFTF